MKFNRLIQINNVSKVFRVKSQNVLVLSNINAEINSGDFTMIFGPSGCGKSTLLHAIEGLETPTNGTVKFFGVNIYDLTEDERAKLRKEKIGIVQQQPSWIQSLNVIENVAFPALLNGFKKSVAMKKAEEMLKRVEMLECCEYHPQELSSGQQQKVAIARALTSDPSILITDEPTGNLDFNSSTEFMKLLQSLNNEGKTIIMVTHDFANLAYAKQIIQMFDGEIVKIFDKSKEGVDLLGDVVSSTSLRIQDSAKLPKQRTVDVIPLDDQKEKHSIFKLKNITDFFVHTLRDLLYICAISLKLFFFLIFKILFLFRLNKLWQGDDRATEVHKSKNIHSFYLIDISFRNMFVKKARAAVTIGGMMIGISVIVLLLSLGYGLEKLVISRVTNLEETKQVEVSPIPSTNLKITDKTLEQLENIRNVENAFPVVGIVGKIKYQNSNTDIAVYGVQADYLNRSAIKPQFGKIFESNELGKTVPLPQPQEEESNSESTDTESLEDLLEAQQEEKTVKVTLSKDKPREAIINTSFLQTLGINPDQSIGQNVDIAFTVTGDLLNSEQKVESDFTTYKIVGYINDTQSPIAYVPLADTKELGIQNYSQVKVITNSPDNVDIVRKQIQSLGFKTESIIDIAKLSRT